LRFDQVDINGQTKWVLRFTNTVWNDGGANLQLRGVTSGSGTTEVYQSIFWDTGSATEQLIGNFVFHPQHNHWHFENFASYELWTKDEYNQWITSGRKLGQARKRGSKTTFCIIDTVRISKNKRAPANYTSCGQDLQGLTVGWGDEYKYYLYDQWVELDERLSDGDYVLRTVADPANLIYESFDKSDPNRDGNEANEAATFFSVKRGRITTSK
jgi:hypothetical protein